ncbi:MAG TPA: hypothetical protein VN457_07055 [Chlamydiales bacterium]|nr:hypothetical protein [Chlamydiales bacterium]
MKDESSCIAVTTVASLSQAVALSSFIIHPSSFSYSIGSGFI